jgi:site-specific recombinase XerD
MEDVDVVKHVRRSTAGRQFPADPPRVDEIIAVMRAAGERPYGLRLRALIVILWRSGRRISEALALAETDLEPVRGSLLVRCGKGGKRREVGMDDWGWDQLRCWLGFRQTLPVGPLLCAISQPAAGRPWSDSSVRHTFRRVAARAGVRRRFAPHQLRHAHAVEMAREGVPLNVIQRQLGHANLGITSVYCRASTRTRSSALFTDAPRLRSQPRPLSPPDSQIVAVRMESDTFPGSAD